MPTGWVGSNRRASLPANWSSEIVPRILRRDHNRCQHIREDTDRKCGRRARDVDHIIPYSQGGNDDDTNLMALCPWHHGKKSGREGGIASGKAKEARAATAKPMHPGLMPRDPYKVPYRPDRDGHAPF